MLRFMFVFLLLSSVVRANELRTTDGLCLRLDHDGKAVSLKIDDRELLARDAGGGFFVADVKGTAAQDDELLGNPSFERLQSGKPVGWDVGGDWSVDQEAAHSGKASMKVSIPGPAKRSSGSLAVEVAVKPNMPYRVSMWMRTEGSAPSFYIVQLDAKGKPDPACPQICISHSKTRSDWFQLTRSFTTGSFCRKISVRASLWQQTGTAWIDEVSVVCLNDDYITPQRPTAGTWRETNGGIEQRCEIPDLALQLRATYKAMPNYVVVDGEVEDSSQADRAIAISFRLPLDAPPGRDWT